MAIPPLESSQVHQLTAQGSLHTKTLDLLKENKLTLPELYRETHIPFYWLKKFSSGEIKDPSVNRVQALYEYLSGRKLKV